MNSDDTKTIEAALAVPFDPAEVKWLPKNVKGNRCLGLPYVDARVVQDRLDEVLGVMGWQDEYDVLPDGAVVCTLRIRIGDEWIQKMDVGGQSDQPDEGDRRKAAFSDALKRAAVKLGVGRYLYRIGSQWLDYDPQARKIVGTPNLPAEALPPRANLLERVRKFEAALVGQGLCKAGELVRHVTDRLGPEFSGKLEGWPESAAARVEGECKAFRAGRADARQVTSEEAEHLKCLLDERAGGDWVAVRKELKLGGKGVEPEDLRFGQYKVAAAHLGKLPKVPAGAR